MAKAEKLYVHQSGTCLGVLTQEATGAMTFQYLSDSATIPLSLSLPMREEIYKGAEVYNYFDNLLPDSVKAREKIAKTKEAKSTRPFDLLAAIGKDCIGALQLTSDKQTPIAQEISCEPIHEHDVALKLSQLEDFPLGMSRDEKNFRISIAGAQEKTSLLWHNDQWNIPLDATPSTHIFKPPMGKLHHGIDLSTSVENEWLCLQICREFGLPTAKVQIQSFGGKSCLVVERFDREWNGAILKRNPQEDICQALGIPSSLKYESDHHSSAYKKPDADTILNLLNQSDRRRLDREIFFKALIVFYILAATDGHGKNFSIFLTPTQFRMTPLYDVMSVYPALHAHQIQQKDVKLAMSIGNERHYKHAEISSRHFFQTAKKNNISQNIASNILDEIITQSETLKENIKLPKDFPDPVANSIFAGCITAAKALRIK